MSDRNALTALIEAVEKGTTPPWRQVFGWDDTINADAAYRGDLNAAKALHEAMLPGWIFDVTNDSAFVMRAVPDADLTDDFLPQYLGEDDNPARAWLLAVLRALASGHPDRK